MTPRPPEWESYDLSSSTLNLRWETIPDADSYTVTSRDEVSPPPADPFSQSGIPTVILSEASVAQIPCGASDGRPLSVTLKYTTTEGETSEESASTTMLCAAPPEPPGQPTLVLGNRDTISVSWTLPLSPEDGGSPVLGFQLFMKSNDEADYTLIQDASEDPSQLHYQMTTDHTGGPISQGAVYELALVARNLVGTSGLSDPLSVEIPFRLSPENSILGPDGLSEITAAIATTVTVTAFDEANTQGSSDSAAYFLHVENVCVVTDNFRCDPAAENSEYIELPLFSQMTDSGSGTFSTDYTINRSGDVTVSVHLAL